jgi:tripartite-type tricarboxylate transporter receptor subunit TctC
MKKRTFIALGAAMAAAPGKMLWAQARYPERPIRLVVPFAPGGDGDIMGRYWVKYVAAQTGASIIVDNKAGAGGAIGAGDVARARGDG